MPVVWTSRKLTTFQHDLLWGSSSHIGVSPGTLVDIQAFHAICALSTNMDGTAAQLGFQHMWALQSCSLSPKLDKDSLMGYMIICWPGQGLPLLACIPKWVVRFSRGLC